jgi:Mor family transcriptional regulator
MLLFLLISLLALNRKLQRHIHLNAQLFQALQYLPSSNIRRFSYKLQAAKRRRRNVLRRRHQSPRDQGDILQADTYDLAGLYEDQFNDLFLQVKDIIVLPRNNPFPKKKCKTSLSTYFRLLFSLDFLRNGPKYNRFSRQYKISTSQVCREVHHILPKIYSTLSTLQIIAPPEIFTYHSFEGVVGNLSYYFIISLSLIKKCNEV